MRKIATLTFGLLAGFAIVWLNQNLDFGKALAQLTINHHTADFFSEILSTQKQAEFAVIMLYVSSKALIVCTPLGALIGLITTKLSHKRIFLYSILLWPIQRIVEILILGEVSTGTIYEITVSAQKEAYAIDILSMFIAYSILYIAILSTLKLLNRKQHNELVNRTENASVQS